MSKLPRWRVGRRGRVDFIYSEKLTSPLAEAGGFAIDCSGRLGSIGFKASHLEAGIWCGSRPLYRSEEHTSELQLLMRISYAVFCLTQKFSSHIPYYTFSI